MRARTVSRILAPFLAAALVVAGVLTAAAGAQDRRVRIVLIADPATFGAGWSAVRAGAERAAAEHGAELAFVETANTGNAVADVVDNLEADPVTGLVLAVGDVDGAADPIRLAREAGLALVSIGAGFEVAQDLGALLHVGQDDHAAGRRAGERLRDLGADAGMCVLPETGRLRFELRCQGLRAGFELPIDTIALPNDPDGADRRADSLLKDRKPGDFLAFAEYGALALAAAKKAAADGKSLRIAAFDPDPDFIRLVAERSAVFGVDSQPELQGYTAVSVLANAARSGAFPVGNIATGPRIIGPATAAALIPAPPAEAQIAPEDGGPEAGSSPR